MDIPSRIASADEPIPELRGRPFEGRDMRLATPIDEMIADLCHFEDDVVGYVERWRKHVSSLGSHILVMYDREGHRRLMVEVRCDAQFRHRSRWLHFLCKDLENDPEREEYLKTKLEREGRCADNRPVNRQATTVAIRDFLRTGGRILIEPDGWLSEGGEAPRMLTHGSDEEAAECMRAGRAYFEARRRWRSDDQIKRAARALGRRTDNGWIVLGGRS